MTAHPEIARAYGDLKQQLAARFASDIDAYSAGKNSFVEEHEAKTLLNPGQTFDPMCVG